MDTTNEPVYMSRRLWGALLSALCAGLVVFFPNSSNTVVAIGSLIAGGLGITSWIYPK